MASKAALVERVKGHWNVTIDGQIYHMNRFGVVWQEQPAEHFSGWNEMLSVPPEARNAVQQAVTDAGYPSHYGKGCDAGEKIWEARLR